MATFVNQPPSVVAEEILKELNKVLREDPNLDELAFLKSVESEDIAPLNSIQGSIAQQALFWSRENHKLAVAYWAIPSLLHAANQALFGSHLRKEDYKIATSAVLILNSDSYTAWNLRKLYVAISPQDLRDELKFTRFILTKHPKSVETWVQRRWALERLIIIEGQDCVCTSELDEERRVCAMTLQSHRRNYYAWRHATWLLSRSSFADLLCMWKDSSRFSREFPSDHSACSYRMALMKAILSSSQTFLPADRATSMATASLVRMLGSWASVRLQFELALLNSFLVQSSWTIETYTGHESQWQARRAVLLLLLQHHKTRAAFVSYNSKDTVVADLEIVRLIDESFALAGKLLKTESDSPTWSGHDSGDFEFRANNAPIFDINESPNDIKFEPIEGRQRDAIIGSGLMDLELAPMHSIIAEVKWAAEQAKENEENADFFKSHVRWLHFQLTRLKNSNEEGFEIPSETLDLLQSYVTKVGNGSWSLQPNLFTI